MLDLARSGAANDPSQVDGVIDTDYLEPKLTDLRPRTAPWVAPSHRTALPSDPIR